MPIIPENNSPSFPYRNILIIKPGAVGDLLQMTPLIRALKQTSPSAHISVLVGTETSRDVFLNNPNVSDIIIYDRKTSHRTPRSLLTLWSSLRTKRFDLVLNFQRSNLRTWLLASACVPCRVLVYHKARKRIVHAVKNYLETLAPLGIAAEDLRLEYFPDEHARRDVKALVAPVAASGLRPIIALNPGASHPVNRWPARRFAELADLLSDNLGAGVIIVGGSGDVPIADEIIAVSRSKPLSLAGKTTLLQLGALLEQCNLLVSGDTGPMHMATAVGTPVAALFGAADPLRTGPVGTGHRIISAQNVACTPCRSRSCSHTRPIECMEALTASRVFEEVAGMLKEQRPSFCEL